jgi:4-aminobutyrate aminotransferase-like enzyme
MMGGYEFPLVPVDVPKVSTRFRKIVTSQPVPESLEIFRELSKYEAKSMHGQLPVVWDRAEDFLVYDPYGNCWIDFTSTIFVANAGHSNPLIISSLKEAIEKKLLHTYTFVNEARVNLLRKLIEMTPEHLQKAFLLSSGTEAAEAAVKLMRIYGRTKSPSKLGIISFTGGMHGRTMCAEMLKGDPKSLEWIGYKDPNIYHIPFPCPWMSEGKADYDWREHFERDIAALSESGMNAGNICGFMIESFQGWGAIFYPDDYIKALTEFARERDILLAFDEIQSGFGRTGKLFACEHYGVEPDLVCVGKGFSSSLPLSAVLGPEHIMNLPEPGEMSSTHSGNPLCCAAGLANLESIESMNLVGESERKGSLLHNRLRLIKKKFPKRVSNTLGKGLIAALLTAKPGTGSPDPLFSSKVVERAMQKGLLLVHTGRESIKIGPPLTIADEALAEGLDVLEESIREIDGELK